jgi:hypothetical protein
VRKEKKKKKMLLRSGRVRRKGEKNNKERGRGEKKKIV